MIDQPMEHDIHLGRNGLGEYHVPCRNGLGEYHVPWIDQSLCSPHGKSLIVYCYPENNIVNQGEAEVVNVFFEW